MPDSIVTRLHALHTLFVVIIIVLHIVHVDRVWIGFGSLGSVSVIIHDSNIPGRFGSPAHKARTTGRWLCWRSFAFHPSHGVRLVDVVVFCILVSFFVCQTFASGFGLRNQVACPRIPKSNQRQSTSRSRSSTYSVLKAACTDRLMRNISLNVSSDPVSTAGT